MPSDSHNRDAEPGPDPHCGSNYGYLLHVTTGTPKCQPCRRAHARHAHNYTRRRYLNRGQHLLIDATGTHRRMRALAAIGWSSGALAARLGISSAAVKQWTRRDRLQPPTVARVAALYDQLWNVPGPSTRARTLAHQKGWPPPLAWDDDTIDNPAARPSTGAYADRKRAPVDEVAVQRAVHGDPVHLHPAERAEAVRRLTAAGHSAADIAERLHTTKRTVVRYRTTPTREAS